MSAITTPGLNDGLFPYYKKGIGRFYKGKTKLQAKKREEWINYVKSHPELHNDYDPETGNHR